MQKKTFYSELAYIFGVLSTALGTALMTHADFGVSMVVAPSYLIHLKVSETLPFYSFGMSGYIFEAFIILLTAIVVRKFRISYLFSFVTAFLFGLALDGLLIPTALIPCEHIAVRILFLIFGMLFVSAGVSMLYHTYIPPEAYELFVKEVSAKSGIVISRVKTAYDLSSLVFSIILSFIFFGFMHFEGIGIGTIVSALLNGFIIGRFTKLFEHYFVFRDRMPWRKYI
ncbi:MAG: hypothetical protein IJ428_06315 [Clostridia bacterium]|nr:hypothetical protein [Clostridia bacterium]